jgi:hypothetical protein
VFFFAPKENNPAVHAGDTSATTQSNDRIPTLNFIFLFIVVPQIMSNYNNIII